LIPSFGTPKFIGDLDIAGAVRGAI